MPSSQSFLKFILFSGRFLTNLLLFLFIIFSALIYKNELEEHQSVQHFRRSHLNFKTVGIKNYPVVKNYDRIDWHDYEFMKYEKRRRGPGEQGLGVVLKDKKEIKLDKVLEREEGLHVVVSDKISVNRSIPDTRPGICQSVKYFKNLPSTSIIITVYNEWWSILLRTIHSIYNRTPRNLLKELIIVEDNSPKPELGEKLKIYLRKNFDSRVKLLRLKQRKGLIVARMEGAKMATGEVLVFLDSHMEVNVNWLPPLLEPIVISPTTVTTPCLDNLDSKTFEYYAGNGTRGVVDELFWYKWFKLRPQDTFDLEKPHQIPILLGCAFAVRKSFFEDIGQFDDGLLIWNGEQIELSFKLHLCGGNLVEVPCSRMTHTFRSHQRNHQLEGVDVAARNFKRVAEVWLDDFKEVMYQTEPSRRSINAGDLTKARLVKERLNCKPFRYFLEEIAPEMYVRYFYQLDYPGNFAWGSIKSFAQPAFCLSLNKEAKLTKCATYKSSATALEEPDKYQTFKLTWHRKIKNWSEDFCLQKNLWFSSCFYKKRLSFQSWSYNLTSKQISNNLKPLKCLGFEDSINKTLTLMPCDEKALTQKWIWSNVNETALRKYKEIFYDSKKKKFMGFD